MLLDFLVLRGSEQSVQITQEELMYKLEDLETFSYTTPEGKDQGLNVRHRHANTLHALVHQSKQAGQEPHGPRRSGSMTCSVRLSVRPHSSFVCRAKAVKDLMLDTGRLKSERQAFQRKRQAYQGYTRDQLASGKPFHDDQDIPTPSSGGGGLRRTVRAHFALPVMGCSLLKQGLGSHTCAPGLQLSDTSMQDSRHPSFAGDVKLDGHAATAPKQR